MSALFDFLTVPEVQELHAAPRREPLLWDALEGMLYGPAEVDAARSIIGEDLLGQIHVASVELLSLIEILSDLRARVATSHEAAAASSPTCLFSSSKKSLLQDRLRLLVERSRVPVEDVLKTPRELQVVDLLTRPASRARSVASSATKSTDSRPTSAASSSTSQTYFDPNSMLQPIRSSLHFSTFHRVAPELRECFRRELDLIVGDTDVIRQSIEREMFTKAATEPAGALFQTDPTEAEIFDITKKFEEAEAHSNHMKMISSLPDPKKRPGLKPL